MCFYSTCRLNLMANIDFSLPLVSQSSSFAFKGFNLLELLQDFSLLHHLLPHDEFKKDALTENK